MSEDLFSVLAAIGIIALIYRWFTTTPTTTTTNGTNGTNSLNALQRRAMNLPRSQVDRLLSMFPQLTENEVRYALVVTRGGVEAVAERVLIRGGLDAPPANFFPPSPASTIPQNSNTNSSSTTANSTTTTTNLTQMNPSLITKLNLKSYKLDQDELINQNKTDWIWEESKIRIQNLSNLKNNNDGDNGEKDKDNDRSIGSSSLKDRKAKMVLEARWKLLQKDKKGKNIATN